MAAVQSRDRHKYRLQLGRLDRLRVRLPKKYCDFWDRVVRPPWWNDNCTSTRAWQYNSTPAHVCQLLRRIGLGLGLGLGLASLASAGVYSRKAQKRALNIKGNEPAGKARRRCYVPPPQLGGVLKNDVGYTSFSCFTQTLH